MSPVTLNCYRSLDTAETHLESTGLDRVAAKRWLARVTDLCIAGHSEIEGYRNSDHQRATMADDGTCRFPGCNTPATTAQIDHVTKYDGGGKTATWARRSLYRLPQPATRRTVGRHPQSGRVLLVRPPVRRCERDTLALRSTWPTGSVLSPRRP